MINDFRVAFIEAEVAAQIKAGVFPAVAVISSDKNGLGRIQVRGILAKERLRYTDSTGFSDIISGIAEAQGDPKVKKITLVIDSPGGYLDGAFDVLDAIQASKKPVEAEITGMAASLAYIFAAATKRIVATKPTNRVGSLGAMVMGNLGPDFFAITNPESEKKFLDPRTDEGRAGIRAELSESFNRLVTYMAAGRGVSPARIVENYGRGAMVFADKALEMGMVDEILAPKRGKGMDKSELKASHPDVYEQVRAEGALEERNRVTALLTAGQKVAAGGGMNVAQQAIASGKQFSEVAMDFVDAAARGAMIDGLKTDAAASAVNPATQDVSLKVPAAVAAGKDDEAAFNDALKKECHLG